MSGHGTSSTTPGSYQTNYVSQARQNVTKTSFEFSQYHQAVAEPEHQMAEANPVDHPPHYGGQDDHYECIKVIEAWGLGFHLGNSVKYISRAGKKGDALLDLKKARWYIDREIRKMEGKGT
jgi:hypothetical protein